MITETVQRAWDVLNAVVEPAVFGPGHPLAISAHHLRGEPITPAEAIARPFGPFAVGDAWGPCWDTTWFRLQGRVPTGWRGREVVLRLEATRAGTDIPGGEFLIFSGTTPRLGLSFQHAAAALVGSAAGGEEIDLFVEAAANPTTPEDRMSGFDWPELRPEPLGEPG
ncbi:MAG TPA: hypothetical protein VFI13_04085, partial [Gemmatimonadales bacterium]|nr:hypothetical protein [Gemmatimonadales bacterium]